MRNFARAMWRALAVFGVLGIHVWVGWTVFTYFLHKDQGECEERYQHISCDPNYMLASMPTVLAVTGTAIVMVILFVAVCFVIDGSDCGKPECPCPEHRRTQRRERATAATFAPLLTALVVLGIVNGGN